MELELYLYIAKSVKSVVYYVTLKFSYILKFSAQHPIAFTKEPVPGSLIMPTFQV